MSWTTVDDGDSRISYSPSVLQASDGFPCAAGGPLRAGASGNDACANKWLTEANIAKIQFPAAAASIPKTVHAAMVPSSVEATFKFTGSGVRLNGAAIPVPIPGVSATGSNATVTIDGAKQDASASFVPSSTASVVFSKENLGAPDSQHTLAVSFASAGQGIIYIDSFEVLGVAQPSSSSSSGSDSVSTGSSTSASDSTSPNTASGATASSASTDTSATPPKVHSNLVVAIVVPIVAALLLILGITLYVCLIPRRRRIREEKALEALPQPYGMPPQRTETPADSNSQPDSALMKKQALSAGPDAETPSGPRSLSPESSASERGLARSERGSASASASDEPEGVTVAELGSAMRRAGLTVNSLLASLANTVLAWYIAFERGVAVHHTTRAIFDTGAPRADASGGWERCMREYVYSKRATAQFNFTGLLIEPRDSTTGSNSTVGSGLRIIGGAVNFSEAPDGISVVFSNESLSSTSSQHVLSLDFTNSQYAVIYIDYFEVLTDQQASPTSSTSDSTIGTGQTTGPTSASKTTPPSTTDSPSSGQATKSVLPDPHRTPVAAIVVPVVAVFAIFLGVTAYICLRRRRRQRQEQQTLASLPQPYRDGMPFTGTPPDPVLAKKEALGLGAPNAQPASQSLPPESSAQPTSAVEPEQGVTVAELGSAMRRAGLTVNNLLASLAVRPSETAAQTRPPSYYD
ncbi:hypothetical protein EXIGLDRAFT_690524 [Exidia glandulosa HHB12029]|uniref:Uncharacterized protein n=1 Tax=Exidia glandulosa HHB12029 TaxID=1314781 RepID=A0A165QJN7_EXIGL|nr:hypothetical protein EXIGLDRAFT_690524 [Exidia glandulosa HHB12029]